MTIDVVQADVASHPLPSADYDLVVLSNMHFVAGEREAVLARAAAALVPGGHLYLYGHHRDDLGKAGPSDPDRLYTEDLVADLLAAWRPEVRRIERPTADGDVRVDVAGWATVD